MGKQKTVAFLWEGGGFLFLYYLIGNLSVILTFPHFFVKLRL